MIGRLCRHGVVDRAVDPADHTPIGELGQESVDGFVEPDDALLEQDHRGHRGDRLAHGRDAKDGVALDASITVDGRSCRSLGCALHRAGRPRRRGPSGAPRSTWPDMMSSRRLSPSLESPDSFIVIGRRASRAGLIARRGLRPRSLRSHPIAARLPGGRSVGTRSLRSLIARWGLRPRSLRSHPIAARLPGGRSVGTRSLRSLMHVLAPLAPPHPIAARLPGGRSVGTRSLRSLIGRATPCTPPRDPTRHGSRGRPARSRRSASDSRTRSTRRRGAEDRGRPALRSSAASGIARAPGSMPASVSPGFRTSTSCKSGSRGCSAASTAIVTRELDSVRSGRTSALPGPSSWPMTRSKPTRPRRTLASTAADGSPTRMISAPGSTTCPAHSANRPWRPTLIAPRKCPAGEVRGLAGVEEDGTGALTFERLVDVQSRRLVRVQ